MQAEPDPELMRRAIAQAREGMRALRGGPFGAIVARGGEILATGENRVTSEGDPTAHAEIVAIRAACRALGTHELRGSVIYASCEPCPMCYAAIEWARLDALFFAAKREDAAAAGFDDALLYEELAKPPSERRLACGELLRAEAQGLFEEWRTLPGKQTY
jgi:guanine deaminase